MKLSTIIVTLSLITQPLLAKSMSFVIDDPGGRNVATFTSTAPMENIVGLTNDVSGKVTFDPQDLSKPANAIIKVDLKSVRTGIEKRDEHMRGENYLSTDKHPHAIFELEAPITTSANEMIHGKPVELSMSGKFTIHGVTRDVIVNGKATFFNEITEMAEHGYPGDMINFDGEFTIKLADYKIKRPQFLFMKVAEDQVIHINFTATTGR